MARRVNTKFLAILTIIIVVALGSLLVANRLGLFIGNPDKLKQEGIAAMNEGRYDEAHEAFGRALRVRENDIELRMLRAETYMRQWRQTSDNESYQKAMQYWGSILQIQPNYVPALKKIVDAELYLIHSGVRSAERFTSAITGAKQLVAADPNDTNAQKLVPMLTIQGWMAGLATSDQDVAAAKESLRKYLESNPSDAEILQTLGQSILFSVRQSRDNNAISNAVKEVTGLVDVSLEKNKGDASILFQCMGLLKNTVAFLPSDKRQQAMDRSKQLALDAQAVVKDGNQDLPDIYLNAVSVMFESNKPDDAIKLLDELLIKLPDQQVVRMSVAQKYAMLGTKYRLKALDLLEKPIGTEKMPIVGPQAMDIATRIQRVGLRVDLSQDQGLDADARKLQVEKAREEYDSLAKLTNEQDPRMLRLLGLVEQVEGNLVGSIQHLEAANTLLRNANQRDPELMYILSRAYTAAGQSGKARDLLKDLVDIAPRFVPAKLDLANLYLVERNPREADRLINEIVTLEPNDPRLLSLKLKTLRLQGKTDEMLALMKLIPEKEMPQILGKARAAMELGLMDEAERLLKLATAMDANDDNVQRSMIDFYVNTGRRAEAMAMLGELIKKHPDDKFLLTAQAQFSSQSSEETLQIRLKSAQALSDPFERAMALGQIAMEGSDWDEAIKQFDLAGKAKPEQTLSQERLFATYLAANMPDKAEGLLDPLIKANTDQAHGLVLNFRLAVARRDSAKALALATRMTTEMPEFSQSWVSMGQALQINGDFANAIERYQRAIALQPVNEVAYRGIIECYYYMQNPSEARRMIEKAISVMPNKSVFNEMLLLWKQGYGNPEEALPARREAAKAQPDDRGSQARLAQNLQQAAAYHFNHGDESGSKPFLTEAIGVLTSAIKKWPDDVSLYVLLRDVYLQSGQGNEAEATVLSLRNRDKMRNSPDVDVLLADLYARQGLTDKAEQAFRKAILKAGEAKADNLAELQVKLSQYLSGNGNPNGALMSLPPDSKEPKILVEKARLLMMMDKLADAQALLVSLQKDHPDSVEGQSLLGFAYLMQRNYPEAEAALNQALKLSAENPMALLNRARVFMSRPNSDLKAAIRDLVAARSIDSNNVDVRMTLASAYRQQNDVNNAVSELVAVISLQPTNKGARLSLVQLFGTTRPPRLLEMEKLLRDTLAMPAYAKDADFILALANLQQRTNPDRALETMQAAISQSPNSAQLYRGYLDILMKSKRYKDLLDRSTTMSADPAKAPWWIYQLRGQALHALGRDTEAMAEIDKGLSGAEATKNPSVETSLILTIGQDIDPMAGIQRIGDRFKTDPYWQMVGARIFLKHNLFAKAIDAIVEAEKSYDKLPENQKLEFLRLAAETYTNARPTPEPEKGRDYNLKLLALRPNDLAALNNLAFILVDNLNQPEEALVYSQKAMDQMTSQGIDEPLVRDTQGWVLVHLPRRYEEGMSILKALADKQQSAEVYVHLARGYMIGQDYDFADRMLTRAAQAIQDDTAAGVPVDPLIKSALDQARQELEQRKAK